MQESELINLETRHTFKRLISMVMSIIMLMQMVPLVQIASAEEPANEIPEMELPEEILSSDVFYLAASTAVLNENGGTYLLRIGRDGDCSSQSGVTIRIADYTAKYGKDYTVSLLEEKEKADSPRSNQSLLEKLEGAPYTESPLLSDEEYAEKLADNPELQAQTEQGIQDAIDFIESEVTSDSAAEDVTNSAAEDASVQGVEEALDQKAEETLDQETEETLDQAETETSDPVEEEIPAIPTGEAVDPLQTAHALFTGIDDEPQIVTGDMDTLQQIQDVADIITQAVEGATLQVEFAPGEQEKHIAIHVKDNGRGDGDRFFYFMLSEPTGTTTNSAASSCAFTIVDDEVQSPSQVSFAQSSYETQEGQNTVCVEIVREGAINTMVSAHLSASSDKALVGRDFSPVDTDVVFPIGIDKRTIEIPIRSDYLNEDADITLTLDEPSDCTVTMDSCKISLTAAKASRLAAGAAEQAFSLSDVVVGDPVPINSPIVTGHSNHYDGNNYYDGSRWDMMWVDNCSGWDHFFGTSYTGLVTARWNITSGDGADIAGAQIDWDRSGSDATMSVTFTASTNTGNSWDSYNGKKAYNSSKSFDRHTENFFSDLRYPSQVGIFNNGGCEDCNHLYIYSIKPIYRPFIIQFDKQFDPSQEVKFLDENGNKTAWPDATFLTIAGAVNTMNDGVVRYTKEGKNSITFMQDISNNATPYVALSYVSAVRSSDGKTIRFATFGSTTSNAYTTTLTSSWVNGWWNYYSFESNNVAGWGNQQSNVYGLRGRITLQPHFKYKNATVKFIQPSNDIGTVYMSGTKRDAKTQSYTYHLGDVIKLKTVINDKYKGIYEPAGYLVSYKQNESDTAWVRYQTTLSMDKDDGTAAFLDENQRLRYGYYEVMPLYQLASNTITVRVKATDVGYFDQEYGLFALGIPEDKITTTTINNVSYLNYPIYTNPVVGKNYALTARLSEGAPTSGYITWQESGKSDKFVGETFFHSSSNNKDANIITLSFNKGTSGSSQRYISISGQATHPTYNMITHQVSTTAKEPAAGALVNFGNGFGVADTDGSFTVAPFRVPFDTNTAAKIRYVVSLNGEELLKEVKLTTGNTSRETVNVIVQKAEWETDDSGKTKEVVHDYLTPTDVTVYRQMLQEQSINVENGSILNDITVTPDSSVPHSGSIITIEGDGEMIINAKIPTNRTYTKYSADKNGKVIEQKNCIETVTAIDFIVCDAVTHQVIQNFAGEKVNDSTFVGKIKVSTVLPGNELYLRVTTDRSHGVYTGSVTDEGINSTVYTNTFTGYTFIQKTTDPVPVLQRVTLPADMKFETLPLIGDTAMQFDFPFCSVGSIKLDTGYRLYIGVSVTQIADSIKHSHMSTYAADDGAYYKDIFSMKHPIQTFAEGLETTYKNAFGENTKALYEGNTASLGAPQWKVDVQLGVYFDFVDTTVTNPETNLTRSVYIFSGVGGYIGVSAGVKMAWYTLIPVVFIPAYFGIEISGNVLGFFGAGTDTSKPQITYDEAGYATVDFDDKLGEFNASVKMAATVQVYVGVGLAGTIGGRGGGTFTAMALWQPSDLVDDWGCALTFTLGMWIDLFLFTIPLQYSFPSIKFGSFEQYSSLNPQVQPVTTNAVLRQPYSSTAPTWTANKPVLQAGFSPVSTQVIENNGYEHPSVKLLTLSDGTAFMAFLDTDLAKGEDERTVLKYTMYKDGKWSTPAVVQDDRCADFQPSICEMEDGKVMLTWVSGDPAKATPTEPEKYLSGMEVFTAVVDTTVGTVSEITQLTHDDYFDYTPTCVYDSATHNRAVYYVKTASNGSIEEMVNSYANGCFVVYMLYSDEDGKWLFDKYYDTEIASGADPQVFIDHWHGQRFLSNPIPELGLNVPNISDFTAVAFNGLSVYAYTIDQDSSNNTQGDKELFLQFCEMDTHKTYRPIRLTNDSVCDALPKLVRVPRRVPRKDNANAADLMLFWFRNEKDVAYLNISELIRDDVVNSDGSIKSEFLTTSDGEVRTLESLYSYAEIHDNATKGKTSMADFDVVVGEKDIYIVWTQPNTITDSEGNQIQSREVYASALIQDATAPEYVEIVSADESPNASAAGSSWSDPYQLTKTGKFTDEPHAVISNTGDLMVVYNSYAQELTSDPENPVIISNFKLNASRMEPCGSIDVVDMSFSDLTPMPGDEVSVQMSVRNTGLTLAENGYTVTVKESDGTTVKEIVSSNKLLPGNTDTYTFTWTIPQNLDHLQLTAKGNEVGMPNYSTYVSDVLTPSPYFTVDTPVIYQDADGFHLLTTVTNEGNLPSREGDILRVLLVGPYGIDGQYEKEARIFAEIPLKSLAPASSMDISTVLNVIPDAFEQYGFVDCYVVAWNTEDNKRLSAGEEIRVIAEKPTKLLLNEASFPDSMTVRAGTTKDFTTTCAPQRLNNNLTVVYSTDNPDVAVFEGSTLHALRPGTVTVTGTVMPYGLETEPITIRVQAGSSGNTEETGSKVTPAFTGSLTIQPAPQQDETDNASAPNADTKDRPNITADSAENSNESVNVQNESARKHGIALWQVMTAVGLIGILAISVIATRKKKK